MQLNRFPVIDLAATGKNILRLRKARGLTVRDIQTWFGFEEPQAVYKWQSGKSLPTVDNLYALSILLQVPMDKILVAAGEKPDTDENEQQAPACCSDCIVAAPRPGLIGNRMPISFLPGGSPKLIRALFRSAFSFALVVFLSLPIRIQGSAAFVIQPVV